MAPKQTEKTENKKLLTRPPVVVVLGHVDHGKTSILDYIRQTQVAAKETGGITQHIGAYQIETEKKQKITFIDTPGHEAFSAMRSRGARVADIAVLVVAADEGIKPQTKEAINHIKKSGLPFLVALNKIDKPNAAPEKIKQGLAENDVVVESYGGKIPSVEVSAKTGQGINDLLEMILLLAEMEELTYDPEAPASGVVIESNMDSAKGPVATLIVKEGVLKIKDPLSCETTYGLVKAMNDWQNKALSQAPAATPVLVLGLNTVPFVGETWKTHKTAEEAKERAEKKKMIEEQKRKHQEMISPTEGQKILNIILKADTVGTLEAVRESLRAIDQQKVILRILKEEAGNINENDLKTAVSAKAEIFGFKIKLPSSLKHVAEREKIKVKTFGIIYELIQAVRESMADLLEPKVIKKTVGKLEVLAVFKNEGQKRIIGGKVLDGEVIRGSKVDILRNEEYVGSGRITQLQHNKQDTAQVSKGKECGLLVESEQAIEENDTLEIYDEEKEKQVL